MKNIVVALDFFDVPDILLQKAKELALAFGAKLWLIHVAAPDPDFVGYKVGPESERLARSHVLREEHVELQKIADDIVAEGIVTEALLVQGATSSTLLEEVEKLNSDLLVIGSHGHGVLYNVVIGSVCDSIVRNAKVPLYIIPVERKK